MTPDGRTHGRTDARTDGQRHNIIRPVLRRAYKNIRRGIGLLHNTCTEYQWLKLKKEFFHLQRDIYLCLAYISAKISSYSKKQNTDILEQIEQDIIHKYSNLGDIILTGDLNARTGTGLDYIKRDSASHIPISNDAYSVDVAVDDRCNKDDVLDSRGKELLELCIANKLRIANGRSFGDIHGKFTCHNYAGSSVVDYFIVSEHLLEDILSVHVSDFLPLSDCHCKLSTKTLSSFVRECSSNNMQEMPQRYKWDSLSVGNFQNFFMQPNVQNEIKLF